MLESSFCRINDKTTKYRSTRHWTQGVIPFGSRGGWVDTAWIGSSRKLTCSLPLHHWSKLYKQLHPLITTVGMWAQVPTIRTGNVLFTSLESLVVHGLQPSLKSNE
jgi:hypothetical protein